MPKQLFLFAGYDKDGIIDDALVYYIKNLATNGDVVLCMDSTCTRYELNKIKPYVLHAIAVRHGEYDFGSYKRAYQYARDNNLLKNYDNIFLLNDSVFGPTINIKHILKRIESFKTDAVGMVVSKHRTHIFMESWFVRLNRNIFTSAWFDDFMNSVTHEKDKADVTVKYEHGLSNLIRNNSCSWDGVCCKRNRFTYNHPRALFLRGVPFMKKMSFTRHNGALGNQIKYVLNHCDKHARNAIMKTANRLYGDDYMKWFLTYNQFKIFARQIRYLKHKIWKK